MGEDEYHSMIEDEYEDGSDGLILSIGDDGKAEIHKPEDYVEVELKDMEIIEAYIEKNKDDFFEFAKKFKLSTEDKK